MNLRILFFTTATEHTTFRKTARMFSGEGADVKILGLTRNNFPSGNDSIPTEIVGTISHGNFFQRLLILLKSIAKLRREAKFFDVIYCFGLDTVIVVNIALMFQRHKVVYQVQDIKKQLLGDSLKPFLLRLIERFMLKKVVQLVVSSEDYYNNFFYRYYKFPRERTTVIENKLEKDPLTSKCNNQQSSINQNSIKIGYFGVMRCRRSWEILKNTVGQSNGQFSLYLRGKPKAMPNLDLEIKNIKGIFFRGLYRSPDDLKSIYESVDIVWAAYPFGYGKEGNWQMARTIRFYEACAYARPVLVQKGTPHASFVRKFNIGKVIDMSNVNLAIDQIQSISSKDVEVWKSNLLKLDRSFFVHSNEYRLLYQTLCRFSCKKKMLLK